jgi:hypothetical protein
MNLDLWDNPKGLIKQVDYFISNLRDDHQVPGNVYYTLLGIANWAREGKPLTNTQISFVIHHLEELEDQLDPFKIFTY